MANETVLVDVDDRGVATVTLNRPQVNNAYNGEMIDGLIAGLNQLIGRDGLRVVVLKGNGKHFQAGADLTWLEEVAGQPSEENLRVSRATGEVSSLLEAIPVPTIAMVQGACVGGATGIVAACDIVVAAEDAVFSISEVRWGLVPHPILPQLTAAIGGRNVRRYAVTAERFTAQKAEILGLVHEVCSAMQLGRTAERIIEAILKNGPEAVNATKAAAMSLARTHIDKSASDDLIRAHAEKRQSEEAAEGLTSFREKRKPCWYC